MSLTIPAASAILLGLCMVLAFWLSRALTGWSIVAARRWGVVSRVSDRSSHAEPTPRLGGIGLFLGFVIPSSIFVALVFRFLRGPTGWGMNPPLMGWILLGAILMFAVGLADDFFDLNPIVKFAGQIVALGPPALAGLRFLSVERFVLPVVSPTMLSMAAALVWMLFFVNAFNFMDGMDGFATRFSLTAIFWLFVAAAAGSVVGFASSAGDSPPGVPPIDLRVECFLLAILSAACGGFYRLNRPPARVFMGDAGSLSLGYLLAAQAILADAGVYNSHPQPPEPGRAVTAPAVFIILFPFTFDVLLTLARRVRRGENLLRAHRSHLYQRLMIAGMTHAETLRVNQRYFVACGAAGCGYALAPTVELRALAAAFALAVMLRYWRFVVRKERAAARE